MAVASGFLGLFAELSERAVFQSMCRPVAEEISPESKQSPN